MVSSRIMRAGLQIPRIPLSKGDENFSNPIRGIVVISGHTSFLANISANRDGLQFNLKVLWWLEKSIGEKFVREREKLRLQISLGTNCIQRQRIQKQRISKNGNKKFYFILWRESREKSIETNFLFKKKKIINLSTNCRFPKIRDIHTKDQKKQIGNKNFIFVNNWFYFYK